jgi:hypothetical protein
MMQIFFNCFLTFEIDIFIAIVYYSQIANFENIGFHKSYNFPNVRFRGNSKLIPKSQMRGEF